MSHSSFRFVASPAFGRRGPARSFRYPGMALRAAQELAQLHQVAYAVRMVSPSRAVVRIVQPKTQRA